MSIESNIIPIEYVQVPQDANPTERGSISCAIDHKHRKEQSLGRRFEELLEAKAVLDNANGLNPINTTSDIDLVKEGFETSSMAGKKVIFSQVQAEFVSKLQSSFLTNLNLYDVLKIKTNGGNSQEIAEEYEKRKKAFHEAKLPERLVMTLAIKDEAEDLLLAKFDYLLSTWKESLREMGMPEEDIETRIVELEDKFLNAQKKVAKVGIAKTLKESIDTASRSSFNPQNEHYKQLRNALGITEDSDDFPTPQRYQEAFEGASYQGRGKVINSQQNRIYKLLTLVAENKDTVSKP